MLIDLIWAKGYKMTMNEGYNMTNIAIAELARLALLSAVEVAAAKVGLSVEEMCKIIDQDPQGSAATFVRKLVGLA